MKDENSQVPNEWCTIVCQLTNNYPTVEILIHTKLLPSIHKLLATLLVLAGPASRISKKQIKSITRYMAQIAKGWGRFDSKGSSV